MSENNCEVTANPTYATASLTATQMDSLQADIAILTKKVDVLTEHIKEAEETILQLGECIKELDSLEQMRRDHQDQCGRFARWIRRKLRLWDE